MKYRSLLLLTAFLLQLVATTWAFAQQQKGEVKSAAVLVSEATAAYRDKAYKKSADLFEQAVAKGAREAGVFYDAACSFALAGNKEKAFEFLNRAVKSGWRRPDHMKSDPDLNSLHADPRWAKAVAATERQLGKYIKERSDPDNARFVTTDIERFWRAYDKAMADTPDQRAAVFQHEYIDAGSVGLKDFARSGRANAKTLAKIVESHKNFYKAIRSITSGIHHQRAETTAAFRKLKQLYPEATFPDSYFVIGQLQSGGTASQNGLLMGAEMFTRSANTPTAELSDWQKGAIMRQDEIPALVAHEAIHFQQKFSSPGSLLCSCLQEGSADFIGELVSGRMIVRMQQAHGWANARERELWEEFQKEMDGRDTSRWLYGASGKGGRPVDLGYWMGYKISEAYYKNAADKKQAIRDTLLMKDCKGYLKASGYAEKFAAARPDQK
jgi:tetratricopeptide (TPR) repeat protein